MSCRVLRGKDEASGMGPLHTSQDSSPPFRRRAGVGMTMCAADGWQFYCRTSLSEAHCPGLWQFAPKLLVQALNIDHDPFRVHPIGIFSQSNCTASVLNARAPLEMRFSCPFHQTEVLQSGTNHFLTAHRPMAHNQCRGIQIFKNAIYHLDPIADVSIPRQWGQILKSDVSRENRLFLGSLYKVVPISVGWAGVKQFDHSVA